MLKLKISGGDGVHVTEFDCKGHQQHAILSMSSPKTDSGHLTRLELEHLLDTPKHKYGIDGIEGQVVGGRLHNNFTMTTCRQSFFQMK